jgi:Amt family ammonium transporter
MQNFFCIGIISVLWVACTYSLAFGRGNKYIGDFHFSGLGHMDQAVPGYVGPLAQSIPPGVFIAFQLMFAIITPALILGSTADRWKFGAFVPFTIAWAVLVYSPIAHWVFSPEGWLFKKGAEDFAGGTVVHANAGAAGLAMCLLLGKRKGYPEQDMRPHNVPFVLLGVGMLWFGWFGFNAGSALGAVGATNPFITTNTATAAAALAWIGVEKLRDGHATTVGIGSGAVAGLVAITPACGFVNPVGSIVVGVIAGGACCLACSLKRIFGFDDALDVIGVHLVGGILGALSLGFLSTTTVNSLGANGIFYGGSVHLLKIQAEAVGASVGYSFVVTLLIGFVINLFIKNRIPEDQEIAGMDVSLHAESAYEFSNLSGGVLAGAMAHSSALESSEEAPELAAAPPSTSAAPDRSKFSSIFPGITPPATAPGV